MDTRALVHRTTVDVVNIEVAIAELRRRAETVPIPLHLPSEAEVAAAERRLGVAFPPDYRRYLLEASDIVFNNMEPAVVVANAGHVDLDDTAAGAWELGVPRDLLPFCEDNGDYYCLSRTGRVRFWSHNGTTDESWPDLGAWITDVWIGESEGDGPEEVDEE
jgi:hypothetical protein